MMKYDPKKHHRRSIRLKGYDYASPGAYFVTICVQGGECLLGDVTDGEMRLNPFGQIVDGFWDDVPIHFTPGAEKTIAVDAHVTMPNHVHAIIAIHDVPTPPERQPRGTVAAPGPVTIPVHSDGGGDRDGGTKGGESAPLRLGMLAQTPPLQPMRSTVVRPTLGQIVAYYKYQTTKLVNAMREMPGVRLWQRNYWEHIIRDDRSYQRIYQYIDNNAALWESDQLHPGAPPNQFNRGYR